MEFTELDLYLLFSLLNPKKIGLSARYRKLSLFVDPVNEIIDCLQVFPQLLSLIFFELILLDILHLLHNPITTLIKDLHFFLR